MKKNDLVEVKIEDMSDSGEGIGHVDGLTLFVKDAVIGDKVLAGITKVKKTYCFARTAEVLEPSEFRVEPKCPVCRPCGGCQMQNLSYEKQLEFKTKKVRDCFERVGGFKDLKINNTLGMKEPWNYRNKAQFPIGLDKEGKPVAGFYAGRTHSVIPTSSCAIQFEGHDVILAKVLEYIERSGEKVYDESSHRGVVRHVLMRKGEATGEIMVVLIINGKKLRDEALFVELLKDIPIKAFHGVLDDVVPVQRSIEMVKAVNRAGGKATITLYGKLGHNSYDAAYTGSELVDWLIAQVNERI